MKTTIRHCLALVLALSMALSMAATSVSASETMLGDSSVDELSDKKAYPIWVNGIQLRKGCTKLTKGDKAEFGVEAGTLSYNPKERILTLKGVKLVSSKGEIPIEIKDSDILLNVVQDSELVSNSNLPALSSNQEIVMYSDKEEELRCSTTSQPKSSQLDAGVYCGGTLTVDNTQLTVAANGKKMFAYGVDGSVEFSTTSSRINMEVAGTAVHIDGDVFLSSTVSQLKCKSSVINTTGSVEIEGGYFSGASEGNQYQIEASEVMVSSAAEVVLSSEQKNTKFVGLPSLYPGAGVYGGSYNSETEMAIKDAMNESYLHIRPLDSHYNCIGAETSSDDNIDGKCPLYWSLGTREQEQDTLIISGSGEMKSFELYGDGSTNAPWSSLKDTVHYVIIKKNVDSIGNNAFCELTNIKEIVLNGETAFESIGKNALPSNSVVVKYLPTESWEQFIKKNEKLANWTNLQSGDRAYLMADCEVALKQAVVPFSGVAVHPQLSVSDGSNLLKSGSDYTVSYQNNVLFGTANLIITGVGSYAGTLSKTFQIVEAQLNTVAELNGNKAQLTWDVVPSADGYDIYGAKGDDKPELLGNTDKTTFTSKKLDKKSTYRYYVKPYRMLGEEKIILGRSCTVYLTQNEQYANATAVTVGNAEETLKVNDSVKISARVTATGAQVSDVEALRYLSENPKVAMVTSKGKVRAVSSGSTVIHVYAANGVSTAVKVTVTSK